MKKTIFIIICILIIIVVIGFIIRYKSNTIRQNDIDNKELIEEIKKETGANGKAEIYEIQTEYDGRKVLGIKANIKYKVALAGMLKGSNPEYSELDEIITANAPKDNGIWIENNSREKITKFLEQNSYLNSKYYIDESGYIKIKDKNSQNDIDKKMENLINGDKQYIIDISSVCYIVDSITGEILDYNFEKMDKYQVYQYFQDDKLMLIFINENSDEQLNKDEIFTSLVELTTPKKSLKQLEKENRKSLTKKH